MKYVVIIILGLLLTSCDRPIFFEYNSKAAMWLPEFQRHVFTLDDNNEPLWLDVGNDYYLELQRAYASERKK